MRRHRTRAESSSIRPFGNTKFYTYKVLYRDKVNTRYLNPNMGQTPWLIRLCQSTQKVMNFVILDVP